MTEYCLLVVITFKTPKGATIPALRQRRNILKIARISTKFSLELSCTLKGHAIHINKRYKMLGPMKNQEAV